MIVKQAVQSPESVESLIRKVSDATQVLAVADTAQKNIALEAIASRIESSRERLLAANEKDLTAARGRKIDAAMTDRLVLNDQRIQAMVEGLRQIAVLPDPVGEIGKTRQRPSGIRLATMRVPLGVIGIIYESRPNVTADAAGLCLKSGNAVVLRGGSEAIHSNCAIADCIGEGLTEANLPVDCVGLIRTTDRAAVASLLQCDTMVDVIIPRGGKSLIERVMRESKIPVIKHLDGICHTYIDCDADFDKALAISINAKTHRYGVCNAMETLLIDQTIADRFLPQVADALRAKGVELRGCSRSREIDGSLISATEEDWRTEYLSPILSIRIVSGVEQAIEHIQTYGSHHTDAIVTENSDHAKNFLRKVDSSSVMVNASTRFADGFEYGLGAEIGISTDKLHVRGPVGLVGLTTRKYVVFGDGHIRE